MSAPLLEVVDLCAQYRRPGGLPWARRSVQVLHGVSLRLERGRTLAVVGESGSGKSTLAKVVVGLHPASAGSLRLDGRPLDARAGPWPPALRRRVQIVFQDSLAALDGHMRIGDILEEPLRVHRIGTADQRTRRVARLLQDVGLPPEYARRFPHQLSGGQRQRAGIARALALEPDLLVLDEPVSALDVSVQAQVLNLLGRLQRVRGLSYLFISHDMAVVRHVADDVAVMQSGRVVEQGECAEVFARPRHACTRGLLEAIPGRALAPPGDAAGRQPDVRCTTPAMHAGAIARFALYRSRQAGAR